MPCDGPHRDERRGEALYEAFLLVLKERRLLQDGPLRIPAPILEARERTLAALREAAIEIVFQDDCEGF